jgi:catechol-2,3-dioxygenase
MPIIGLRGFGLEVPDISVAATFYADFGLESHEREAHLILRCRGRDQDQIVVSEGPSKRLTWISFSVEPGSLDQLSRLVEGHRHPRADGPVVAGDGQWFRDPDGLPIHLTEAPLAKYRSYVPMLTNTDDHYSRVDTAYWQSITDVPCPRRLGHVIKYTADIDRTEQFYLDILGLRLSDRLIGRISLWNAGHGDHHIFGAIPRKGSGLHHASFEVANIDEIGHGAQHMKELGHGKAWGPGRHTFGSNLFVYIQDPWGSWSEYFADMDRVTPDWKGTTWNTGSAAVWGPPMPADFHANVET